MMLITKKLIILQKGQIKNTNKEISYELTTTNSKRFSKEKWLKCRAWRIRKSKSLFLKKLELWDQKSIDA